MSPTPEEVESGNRSLAAGIHFDLAKLRRERQQASAAMAASNAREERSARQVTAVERSPFAGAFNHGEKEAIAGYYRDRDSRGAMAEGRNAAISALERLLRQRGIEIEEVSVSNDGKSKSIFARVGDGTGRISDHELPMTAEREHNRLKGLTGRWECQSRRVSDTDPGLIQIGRELELDTNLGS